MDFIILVLYAMAAVLALWSLASLVASHKQRQRHPSMKKAATEKPASTKPLKPARRGKVPERYSFDI